MIDPQLAPPPVAASRGPAQTGTSGGEDAPEHVDGHPESFSAALGRRSTHRASDDAGRGTHNKDAAGPRTGELQGEDAADAGASQEPTTAAADTVTTAIASAIATAAGQAAAIAAPATVVVAAAVAPATPVPVDGAAPAAAAATIPVAPAVTGLTTTAATTTAPATTAAATAAATADGVPAPAPTQGTATSATTQITAGATPPAASATEGATDGAAAAQAVTPPATSGTTVAAPAATVSLTLTPVTDEPATGAQATPQVAAAQAQHAAKDAPAPAAAAPDQAPAPARADLPAGVAIGTPPAQQTRLDALSGTVTHGGGTTTPHELAKELGQRVHMAIREGGRELLVNLRPPDLGHLTIRVTMTDGVMQAQITADRPEAAKLLQQSLGNLGSALGDLGYAMGNLDVAYQGGRDAQASSQGSAARGDAADAGEAAGDPVAPAAVTTTGTGDTPGLDLLA